MTVIGIEICGNRKHRVAKPMEMTNQNNKKKRKSMFCQGTSILHTVVCIVFGANKKIKFAEKLIRTKSTESI